LEAREGVQLREWLQVPAQRDVIVDAAKLYHGADIVAILAEMVPVGFGTPAPKLRRGITPFKVCVALVMGAVVAAGPIMIFLHPHPAVRDPRYRPLDSVLPSGEAAYSTKVGETRTFSLEDGSKLALNSHTGSECCSAWELGSRPCCTARRCSISNARGNDPFRSMRAGGTSRRRNRSLMCA
jgi:hypothetical protein